eukprot:339448-Lingulodinium_polyedra.AAC.1
MFPFAVPVSGLPVFYQLRRGGAAQEVLYAVRSTAGGRGARQSGVRTFVVPLRAGRPDRRA